MSEPPSKSRIFLRRLASSLVLWTLVVGALFSGNRLISDYVFLAIMILLAGVGLAEFYGLVEKRDLVCFKSWGIFGGLLLMVGTFLNLTGQLGTSSSLAKSSEMSLFLVKSGVFDFPFCSILSTLLSIL